MDLENLVWNGKVVPKFSPNAGLSKIDRKELCSKYGNLWHLFVIKVEFSSNYQTWWISFSMEQNRGFVICCFRGLSKQRLWCVGKLCTKGSIILCTQQRMYNLWVNTIVYKKWPKVWLKDNQLLSHCENMNEVLCSNQKLIPSNSCGLTWTKFKPNIRVYEGHVLQCTSYSNRVNKNEWGVENQPAVGNKHSMSSGQSIN